MKNELNYRDLIDMEHFFVQDEATDAQSLHERDRTMYLQLQDEKGDERASSPTTLIKAWIHWRTAQDFDSPERKSLGSICSHARRILNIVLLSKGVLVGVLAGLIFFSYSGTTPINVFHFLLFFVFSQLGLSVVLVCSLLLRKFFPGLNLPSFYFFLFHKILKQLISLFQKKWNQRIDGAKRLSFERVMGVIKIHSKTYGFLFYWPIFLLFQLFGIGFNLGLLATTLFKISTSDLAFGWQSTIQLSGAAIFQVTKFLSFPWRSFVPADIAHPSLQEIEGSRIILKDGIFHLSTIDLIAWWPFLVFCLLCYGFFFRLVFWGFAKVMERQALKKVTLNTTGCLRLLRRMQTPVVTTQAGSEAGKNHSPAESHTPKDHNQETIARKQLVQLIALVPDEIFHICTKERIQPHTQKRGLLIYSIHRFMEDYDKDQELLNILKEKDWSEGQELLIIMEGWMVPLVDFLTYLKKLRQLLAPETMIHLGLVGCPEDEDLTVIKETDYNIWKQKVMAHSDPYLDLFPLLYTRSSK